MFTFELGGLAFTFTIAHFLILIAITVGMLFVMWVVQKILYDPFHFMTWATIAIVVLIVAMAFFGVFEMAELEIAKTGAVAMNYLP
ncbi:MAG: aa3-type cytochrome c oxidase subunit IV [Candidatus Diapherotrites archaeon]|nr:aa3-type cytochrome c oxidase subunit IV [Candidatus Diapherotrites archaeon]